MRLIVLCLLFLGCKPDVDSVKDDVSTSFRDLFDLQVGDILFQDLDCGPFCDAIEAVTYGVNGADFSHNGLISKIEGDEVYVLEAVSAGVVETPLDTFLLRSKDHNGNPKVLVGRLDSAHVHLASPAVDSARLRLGKSYDHHFDIMNDRYYCSELLYYAFKEANGGLPIFQLRAMTYIDPDTKHPFPQWVDYFQDLKTPIPENLPGLNPGSMSRNTYLEIIHAYGNPSGWRGMR